MLQFFLSCVAILYQFLAQNALFKGPISVACRLRTIELFRKFIRFGSEDSSPPLPGQPSRLTIDKSCLDFCFWGVAMEKVRKSRLSTLPEPKAAVDAFAERVEPEEVKRLARST